MFHNIPVENNFINMTYKKKNSLNQSACPHGFTDRENINL